MSIRPTKPWCSASTRRAAFKSWIERWFGEITRQRIRRGTFESVPSLVAAIDDYLAHYNTARRRFVWTKDAGTILAKIDRAKSCPKVLYAGD